MSIIVPVVSIAFVVGILSFWLGYIAARHHERQKAWRRGLYEHSQLTQEDDDNPPGSL